MIAPGKRIVMVTMRRGAAVLLTACLTTAATGCGQPEGGDSAAAVARGLLTAVAAGDGSTACGVLAPDTRAELEESAGKACAEAITEQSLPPPTSVRTVDVYGKWAR